MILDLIFAGFVLTLVVLVGIKRNQPFAGPSERFGAGRQLSWLTLGASMAASSTSADTPLLIAGAVYMDGLAGNWFWWAGAPGVLATLFFFARLWRRSGVLTEVEIFRLRYGAGVKVRRYRMFQAFLEGVVLNVLVMASNGYAFALILGAMLKRWQLDANPFYASCLMIACFFGAAGYAVLVGFRGLAKADAAAFLVALIVGIVLAGFAIAGLPSGIAELHNLHTSRSGSSVFAMWPAQDRLAPVLLLTLGWWHSAPGRGLLIQRIAASRDERSAMLTVGTFAVLHFLFRPWCWYLVGAAALFYLPAHSDPDQAMPALAGTLLPHGLFGIILAVTALSFIGCVNSRLNFGASYIVNDVALALKPSLSARITRRIEISVVLVLMMASIAFATYGLTSSIRALYQFLTMVLAGTGFVAIARWYWWRTSISCEIASLISAAVIACLSLLVADMSQPADFAVAVAVNFTTGAIVTVIVAFAGQPAASVLLQEFHDKVLPGGLGWRKFGTSKARDLPALGGQWLLANLALFSTILACAKLLVLEGKQAALSISFALICVGALCWIARRTAMGSAPLSSRSAPKIEPGEHPGDR